MNSERPAVVITRQRRTLKKYHGNYRNRVEIVFMRVTGHVEEEERQRSRGETSGCKTQNDRETIGQLERQIFTLYRVFTKNLTFLLT